MFIKYVCRKAAFSGPQTGVGRFKNLFCVAAFSGRSALHKNGLGRIKPEQIEIAGESLQDVTPDEFEKPPTTLEGISPYEKIKVVPGRPCSNCIAGLASYLHGYVNKDIVNKAFNEIKILVGAGAEAEYTGNEIAIGNCLKKYDGKIPYCPGCPPPSDAYLGFVEKMLLPQPE